MSGDAGGAEKKAEWDCPEVVEETREESDEQDAEEADGCC